MEVESEFEVRNSLIIASRPRKSKKTKTAIKIPDSNHLFPINRYDEFSNKVREHIC